MIDETPRPAEATAPQADVEPALRARRRWVHRWARRVLAFVVAVVSAAVVSVFSIDLGRIPQLREVAEREGSKYLERPLHIGRISAYITPGRFALHDVVIDGKHAGDRPFMRVSRIDISVPWWTLLRRQLHVNLTLDDWAMVVETWANGEHNIPKLMPRTQSTGPRRFTTTVDFAYARGGHFIYDDHVTPWSVVAPNLSFSLVRATSLGEYVGTADFSGGTVRIQGYKPMETALSTRFMLDGPRVQLRHIDLVTEGSRSHVNGQVDFSTRPTPTQIYNVNSDIDFARMKDIFFAKESWRLGGSGQFTGIFKLSPAGRDLSGEFSSEDARVNDLEFSNLHGDLTWTPTLFAVLHADTDFLDGHARFDYSIAPLGSRTGSTASFNADYTNLDLFDLDRRMSLRGLRLAGLASGNLALQWPNGRFGTGRRGTGRTFVTPPAGIDLAPVDLPAVPRPIAVEPRPFDSNPHSRPLVVGANVVYAFDPAGMTFEDSWAATTHSFISFKGRMARDGTSQFPFHVTSHDWQESDRLLASIMTAVSGPTGAVEVGGRGTFDGVMTGSFSAPRIDGRFAGEGMRVWDVTWGKGTADLVIEGGYVDISNSRIGDREDASIVADGRFSLGFRKDDKEEIRARVRLVNWPITDLRHAFELDDWPMEGTLGLAELDLTGKYRSMFGSGLLRIDRGRAWDEPFDVATGSLELEGTGMRIGRIEMRKGPGLIHGAARIGWDGTYAFNADGENVPVESLENFRFEQAPLTGRLKFRVSGASEFDRPTYTFDASIDDLFIGDEGIGSVTGRATVSGKVMTVERLVAASSRLQVVGSGTIGLDDLYTSDVRLRFSETALDPYLKFLLTDDISPYTRVVVGGSLGVRGPLGTPDALDVDATIDDATLTLFDYDLRNDGPLRLTFQNGAFSVPALKLRGNGTNLALTGGADTRGRTLNLSAVGDSNLAVLQLFPQFAGITASGAATLNARLTGSFDAPRLTGDAVIVDGRVRPLASPHSLERINGRIEFGSNAITMSDVTGRIGSGDVEFGGSVALDGYRVAEYNLTARGRSMRLRYPQGFSSTVDMNLFLVGTPDAPRLSGSIDVLRVAVVASGESSTGLFGLAAGGVAPAAPVAATSATGTALALDIQVTAPPMPFINTEMARVEGRAALDVRGTFDRPSITGTIDILGGEALMYGNRYFIREGSIDFRNRDVIEPEFSVSAETRPRVSGQTYTVTVGVEGTFSRLTPTFTSDPWLPPSDVISLLLGGVPNIRTAEQRALRSSQELQEQMLQTAGAVFLTAPLTSRVGQVVERTGAFDTVQITPVLTNETAFQQLNPSARVTLGKRISPRVFLTYSRTLGGLQEEIILLEYDQSDRMSWVLSRNEDRTFALDFRIRYVF